MILWFKCKVEKQKVQRYNIPQISPKNMFLHSQWKPLYGDEVDSMQLNVDRPNTKTFIHHGPMQSHNCFGLNWKLEGSVPHSSTQTGITHLFQEPLVPKSQKHYADIIWWVGSNLNKTILCPSFMCCLESINIFLSFCDHNSNKHLILSSNSFSLRQWGSTMNESEA